MDPDEIVQSALAEITGGTGGTSYARPNSYGPIYKNPARLIAAGVPEELVTAYMEAARYYAEMQQQAAAGGLIPNAAVSRAASDAYGTIKSLENQIAAYFKPTAEPKGAYFEDDYGNRLYQPPNDLGPGEAGPPRPASLVWENPDADLQREAARLRLEQLRAQIAASNRSGQGSPTEWANIAQRGREFDWQTGTEFPEKTRQWNASFAQDAEKMNRTFGQNAEQMANQVAQWRAQNEQAQQNLASSLANWWTDAQIKAAPMAMLPGQEYLLGAEPGGIYANIARMSGRSFDPGQMRAQPIAFDPIAAWRSAQQQVGVK